MKVLYDTSVLVPALLSAHSNHLAAFSQLEMAKQGEVQGYLSTHSLTTSPLWTQTFQLSPNYQISVGRVS